MAIKRIMHVCLNCRDMKKSVKFYTELLGMKVISVSQPKPDDPAKEIGARILKLGVKTCDWDGRFVRGTQESDDVAVIDLVEWKEPKPVGQVPPVDTYVGLNRLAFAVDNIEKMYEELKAKGIEFTTDGVVVQDLKPDLGIVKLLFFRDPDGVRLEFYQQVP